MATCVDQWRLFLGTLRSATVLDNAIAAAAKITGRDKFGQDGEV
jgi:hypothetical protein